MTPNEKAHILIDYMAKLNLQVDTIQFLEKEAKILDKLKHPNIIEIVDASKEPLKNFLQKNSFTKHIHGF